MSFDPDDLRSAFVTTVVKEHAAAPAMKQIAQFLISDQGRMFFEAPFGDTKYNVPGGLARAMLDGYVKLRVLSMAAEKIIGPIDHDRAAVLWVTLMTAFWADGLTGISVRSPGFWISPQAMAIQNARIFGFDLKPEEIEILIGDRDIPPSFFPLSWVLDQTLELIEACVPNKR